MKNNYSTLLIRFFRLTRDEKMYLVYAAKYFPVFTAPSYYFPVTDIIVLK